MNISQHLTAKEVSCKCGCGYCSKPENFSCKTALAFEEIRRAVSEKIGKDTPIIISSGCRCPEHNYNIGGAVNSRHMHGDALDLVCPEGISYEDFYDICDKVIGNKGGVGKYLNKNIVHIDTRGERKRW